MQYLVQLAGTHNRVFPIRVVQLDLDKFCLRVGIQRLFQVFGASVEGKAEVAYLPLRLLLKAPAIAVQLFICLAVAAILYRVQEVEVKIIYAASLQLLIEDAVPVLRFAHAPGRELCSEHEAFPGMPLHQRFLHHLLGVAPMVDISGVKVVHSRLQIGICHAADLFKVDSPFLFRQPHHAEPELWHTVQIDTHVHSSSFLFAALFAAFGRQINERSP